MPTEKRKHGSTSWGVFLIVLGAIALLVPLFAALFVIKVLMWLLVFAAIEQVIYAFQTRGEGAYSSNYCWVCYTRWLEVCYSADPLPASSL